MPFYSFKCQECDEEFEENLRIGQEPAECPACGKTTGFDRLLGDFSITDGEIERLEEKVSDLMRKNKEQLVEYKRELEDKRKID